MRTAYCISAYKDAPLLDRLIGALEGDDTCFIVHVDRAAHADRVFVCGLCGGIVNEAAMYRETLMLC